ncbi:MAG: TonB family protein [Bacteroidales bacterium]|jgi:protein TonB|nr:TonB family protein [Bacteroidales bacterium]MDY0313510.1 TonB family protein [Bacteroidales bacterium]NLB86187.1 TonB family protein [Bacteroidales bacterium]
MQIKKSEKADLESRKFLFFLIGLSLALASLLFIFEWTSKDVTASSLGSLSDSDYVEEEIENTIQEAPPEELDEPEPEPEPETIIEELTVVDDDVKVADIKINTEADEKTQTSTRVVQITEVEIVEEEVEPIAFAVVETKPEYPGGDAALMKFISENTKYPEIAKENGIQGRVFIQFVIDATGKVTKVQVAKGVDPYLDSEAMRVVKTLPSWSPGKQRGKNVPVTYIVPINFKLY